MIWDIQWIKCIVIMQKANTLSKNTKLGECSLHSICLPYHQHPSHCFKLILWKKKFSKYENSFISLCLYWQWQHSLWLYHRRKRVDGCLLEYVLMMVWTNIHLIFLQQFCIMEWCFSRTILSFWLSKCFDSIQHVRITFFLFNTYLFASTSQQYMILIVYSR